ncbi:hypothetical protein KAR91_12245 [Candidatus Pacearchaeota archaeon]|nr:hypothetical protein [Candidatus Pacearchaeota archaeon]
MLAEKIEVTVTPTTIRSLIETARGLAANGLLKIKCIGIMLRYDLSETAVVTMTDPDTVNGVVVLDMAGQTLSSISLKQFDIQRVLLSASASVDVHVIIEQTLV